MLSGNEASPFFRRFPAYRQAGSLTKPRSEWQEYSVMLNGEKHLHLFRGFFIPLRFIQNAKLFLDHSYGKIILSLKTRVCHAERSEASPLFRGFFTPLRSFRMTNAFCHSERREASPFIQGILHSAPLHSE